MKNPRNGARYRRLVAELKAQRQPCWLCGHDIDPTLPATNAWSFTLDHLTPLSKGGSLLDPANARSAHRRCNSARGNRISIRVPGTSRRW